MNWLGEPRSSTRLESGGRPEQTRIFGIKGGGDPVGGLPGESAAGADRVDAAARIVDRQAGGDQLLEGYAVIGVEVAGSGERQARATGQPQPRREIGEGVGRDVAEQAVIALDALEQLAADAQPLGRVDLGEDARLAAERHLGKAP